MVAAVDKDRADRRAVVARIVDFAAIDSDIFLEINWGCTLLELSVRNL